MKLVGLGLSLFFSVSSMAVEVDLSTYEEVSAIIKNKTFTGGKDESSLKLLPQVIEPTRKIQGSVEENETTMSNE